MDVNEYIATEMNNPFVPGETDCANTADRWFAIRHGFSPMARYGRQVRNVQDMDKWLSEPQGIVKGIKDVMRASGVARSSDPVSGDIGILIVGTRVCIALYNGETWWSRDADGFIVTDDSYRHVAWSVG